MLKRTSEDNSSYESVFFWGRPRLSSASPFASRLTSSMSRRKKAACGHHSQSQHCTHSHSHSDFFSSSPIFGFFWCKQSHSDFFMFYIHEWSGENEPPGMNLCWIGCTLFKLVNSEVRGSLWTKKPFFGSENFWQNNGTREKKKLRNVMNFLEIFVCINIPVTNVFSYSCRWVLRINLAARPGKGQISDLIHWVL